MGSSNDKTLSFSGTPEAAFAAAERALTAIGARVTSADPTGGTLAATKGESFVSRGESITVRVERAVDGCALHLRSESHEDIDWGRNAGNIAQFEQALTGGAATRGSSLTPLSPRAGDTLPNTAALSPSPATATPSDGIPEPAIAKQPPEAAASAPSIFGPSTFASVFASVASVPVEQPTQPLPRGDQNQLKAEDEAPALPAPEALDPAVTGPGPVEAVTTAARDEPPAEAARVEAQALLVKLEARRASLEASASPPERAARPLPSQDEDRSWQRGGWADTPTREPEPSTAPAEGRFFCSVDGEFGPVEPCARCGLYLCARHRRRSKQSALFTDARYVCEGCYQIEVAEERGSSLNVRPATVAPSFPNIQRTESGWQMQAGGKPANVWAALGTAISLLLVVLLLTALTRSFRGFFFFLVLAVIGGYIWGFNVHWWANEYLAAAPPGRKRVVWLLAAPGLFIAGISLRLVQQGCRIAGASERAARLDPTREQIITAAEDAWNQAIDG